jgi:hypothetical protein
MRALSANSSRSPTERSPSLSLVIALALWITTALSAQSPPTNQPSVGVQSAGQGGSAQSKLPPHQRRTREVPVFFLLGQSNCAGGTNGFWLSHAQQPGNRWPHLAYQPFVKIWWPGNTPARPLSVPRWEDYRTGVLDRVNNSNAQLTEGNFGPEAAFGEAASLGLGEAVYLFKYSVVAPMNPAGDPTFSKVPGRVTVFDDILRDWRRADAALRAFGLIPKVLGIMIIHGEYDMFVPYAPTYAQHLSQFIVDLRAELSRNDPDSAMPKVVLSQLHDRHVPRAQFVNSENLVRAAQVRVTQTVPEVYLTETGDLTLDVHSPNYVHFDAPGSIRLGARMFATFADREVPPRR